MVNVSGQTVVSRVCDEHAAAIQARWRDRGKGRRILTTQSSLKRVRLCGHQALGNMVSLKRGPNGADYGKVAVCGSVWVCPVCSARILAERTTDVMRGFEVWQGQGGTVGMATLTVRHRSNQSLKAVWGVVGKAWSRMTSGRPWGRIVERLGLGGWMRTVEVTHGRNGWHVHLHVLLFLEPGADPVEWEIGVQLLLERWASSVAAVGGSVVARAQDVRRFVNPEAGDLAYFAKAYYGGADREAAFEVTRSDLKSGAGRAPFEILRDAIASGSDVGPDWALWREFEQASHRKRMHTWSGGMRDRLGLDDERSDEDIAADEDVPEVETVGWLTRSAWSKVRASDALYWGLLDAVEHGGLAAALAWGSLRGIEILPPGAERNFYRFVDADLPRGYQLG